MDHNNQEKSGFTYTYSAKEQAELKRIREKYTASTEDEDKMTRYCRWRHRRRTCKPCLSHL